jgi:hypothetical protein
MASAEKTGEIKTAGSATGMQATTHHFLFSGHMIDKPGRAQPRFPASRETEVKEMIRQKLLEEKNEIDPKNIIAGIAGGASGGDILFHELCAELGIATTLYLAMPKEEFIAGSVAFAGQEWIERFDSLYRKLPHRILPAAKDLPGNTWQLNNLWQLNGALINGSANMTLIALWDGRSGDGAGGTAHMVKAAKESGAKQVIIGL